MNAFHAGTSRVLEGLILQAFLHAGDAIVQLVSIE
jgi:hypothetical protein